MNESTFDDVKKKELGLMDLIFLGLGCIIGSGVFVILGRTIKFGGKYTLISFIIVALLSLVMGYCYIEIYSRYKSDITEYLAVKNNIGEKTGKITLIIIYLFSVFSAITVVVSITKYIGRNGFNLFKNSAMKEIGFSIFLITVMTIINLAGIKTSKLVCNSIGIMMMLILGGIILLGGNKVCINKLKNGPKIKWDSFVLATILALFLFNGFDIIVKMSDEAKNEKDTKKALVWTITSTGLIYLLVIIIGICILGYGKISGTYHPISMIYEYLVNKKFGYLVYVLGGIILFNTAFLTLIGATRFLYGLARDDEIIFSDKLSVVDKNKTPRNAIYATFGLSVASALLNNEVILAVFTNFSAMYILILVAISVLIIRWRERNNEKEKEEHNYIRGNIGNIPVPVVLSLMVMIYFMGVILKNKFWLGNKNVG